MNSSNRRLQLIMMLRNPKRRWTVKELSEEFGVSERTIYRDMNELEEMNVPVSWDPYQGYSIIKGYSTPPLMFTDRELATIMIGLSFVHSQIDKTLIDDARGIELKIYEILPDDLKKKMDSLQKRTIVDPYRTLGKEQKQGGSWYTVTNAIAERETVILTYRSKTEEKTSNRRVDPYLLVYYSDHWNVIGYCHKRKAPRNFILDRVEAIEKTGDNYVIDARYDTNDLIYGIEKGDEYEIVLEVRNNIVEQLVNSLPAESEIIRKIGQWTTIQFTFDNLDFINKWLLSYNTDLSIIKPDRLIKMRNKLLKEMMQ